MDEYPLAINHQWLNVVDEKEDIRLSLIRSLAIGGEILSGPGVSLKDQAERIRVVIIKGGLHDKYFEHAATMTYGQAYELVFGGKLERRSKPRD
jgi:hypothetical protein